MPRLRRVDCAQPGIRRVKRGRGFNYVDACGNRVTDAATLARYQHAWDHAADRTPHGQPIELREQDLR